MNKDIDLKELERKAYRSIHQDGVWDIFLGMIMIAMGVYGTLSNLGIEELLGLAIFVALEAVAILIMIAGKKYITVPRIGIVKPGPERKRKLDKARIALVISVFLGLFFFLAVLALNSTGEGQSWPWFLFPAIFGLNVLVIFGLLAYYLDYSRLYVIAVLFASTILLLEIIKLYFESNFNVLIAFGVPGAIVVGVGLTYLLRFLREYPLPKEEVANGL